MDVALTVTNGILGEGPGITVTDCPAPVDRTELIYVFEDMRQWEETQKPIVLVKFQCPATFPSNGIINTGDYN